MTQKRLFQFWKEVWLPGRTESSVMRRRALSTDLRKPYCLWLKETAFPEVFSARLWRNVSPIASPVLA